MKYLTIITSILCIFSQLDFENWECFHPDKLEHNNLKQINLI